MMLIIIKRIEINDENINANNHHMSKIKFYNNYNDSPDLIWLRRQAAK